MSVRGGGDGLHPDSIQDQAVCLVILFNIVTLASKVAWVLHILAAGRSLLSHSYQHT